MDAPLFAAPAANAAHTTGGGLASVTLALILIVALIAGLAWFARRLRGFGGSAANADRIQVLASHAFGVKERCVLVRIGDTDILIGVTQNSVHPLHVFPAGANTEAPPPAPATGPRLANFKDLLMRSLGK